MHLKVISLAFILLDVMTNKGIKSDKYQWRNIRHQYFSAIAANIIFLSHGCVNGWMSPALPVLLSDETPLESGPLTTEQLSWIGSINALGGVLGTFTFGFFTVFLGCKRVMLFLTLPSVVFWLLVYFGDSYYHLLIARLASGWSGGGIQATVILYISDIANDDIRGRLGSISHLTRNIGILVAYILGAIVEYKTMPCIFIVVPIVFAITFFFLPNTPQYYLRKGELEKAENALKFYKGCRENNVEEASALKAELERLKLVATKNKVDEKTKLKDFLQRDALRGILNGVILACLAHSTGFLVFITYAMHIFDKVGATHINPYTSSIILAVLQLVGTLCTTRFSDTLGRKALLITSLLGSAFGLLSFASYSYLKQNAYELSAFEWIPVVSLSFVIFIASAGVVPLMFICIVENLPSKIRTIGLTICNIFMNISSFACLKLFPIWMVIIGLHGCMLILAIACVLGSFYVFVIKETKGISLDGNDKNHNEKTPKD